MRGKALSVDTTVTVGGITPAYAGKSLLSSLSQLPPEDHPRLCGEKRTAMMLGYSTKGSPPPMRGKVYAFACFFPLCRITPAYAGKSDAYDNLLNYT